MPAKSKKVVVEPEVEVENEEVVEEEEVEKIEVDETEEKVEVEKEKKAKPTISDHVGHYMSLIEFLDVEIDRKCREKEKGVNWIRKFKKMVITMKKELPMVWRSKALRKELSSRSNRSNGLTVKVGITKELAQFLQVPEDTQLSRVDVLRAICVYSHLNPKEEREDVLRWAYLNPDGKRNLQNPKSKLSILPNKDISKLLRYDQYKKDVAAGKVVRNIKVDKQKETKVVTDDVLYYYVIQKLMSIHFAKQPPKPKVAKLAKSVGKAKTAKTATAKTTGNAKTAKTAKTTTATATDVKPAKTTGKAVGKRTGKAAAKTVQKA